MPWVLPVYSSKAPGPREGSSASYSECVAVCYIWVPLKEWGRATHCLGLGVALPPPGVHPDPADSCFSPSPIHVLKAEVQGEWPAREALHLAGLTLGHPRAGSGSLRDDFMRP